jgi:hypothetical protein
VRADEQARRAAGQRLRATMSERRSATAPVAKPRSRRNGKPEAQT